MEARPPCGILCSRHSPLPSEGWSSYWSVNSVTMDPDTL